MCWQCTWFPLCVRPDANMGTTAHIQRIRPDAVRARPGTARCIKQTWHNNGTIRYMRASNKNRLLKIRSYMLIHPKSKGFGGAKRLSLEDWNMPKTENQKKYANWTENIQTRNVTNSKNKTMKKRKQQMQRYRFFWKPQVSSYELHSRSGLIIVQRCILLCICF